MSLRNKYILGVFIWAMTFHITTIVTRMLLCSFLGWIGTFLLIVIAFPSEEKVMKIHDYIMKCFDVLGSALIEIVK